jgi:LEM domain
VECDEPFVSVKDFATGCFTMEVKERVTKLTDDELSQQLKALKQDVGPITPSTRPLYEKRLLRCILLEQASTCTITYSQQHVAVADCSERSVSAVVNGTQSCATVKETDLMNDLVDSGTYYGVQLPPELHKSGGMIIRILF